MVAWNNYVMRKYGSGIRKHIVNKFGDFLDAVGTLQLNKTLIRQAEMQAKIEEDRLKDIPNLEDIKDEDFFKDR